MFWRIVDLKSLRNAPCLFRRERLVKGADRMGVEVVHDKDYLFCVWFDYIPQVPYLFRPVHRSPHWLHVMLDLAGMGLDKTEDAHSPVPDVFRIDLCGILWAHWQRFPAFAQELVWLFVHAPKGKLLAKGLLVDVQHVLHAGDEISILRRRDAPVLVQVRVQVIAVQDAADRGAADGLLQQDGHLICKERHGSPAVPVRGLGAGFCNELCLHVAGGFQGSGIRIRVPFRRKGRTEALRAVSFQRGGNRSDAGAGTGGNLFIGWYRAITLFISSQYDGIPGAAVFRPGLFLELPEFFPFPLERDTW